MDLNAFIALTAVKRYGALQKPEELAWLLGRLEKLRLRIIVEIGCDAGGTLYVWNRIAPIVLGVDLPGGPFSTGRDLTSHGSTLILGDSHDFRISQAVGGFLVGQGADMLFLDGDHTFEGVSMDYEQYRGLVRPGGAIVLQDIRDHHRPDVGVHQLWGYIKEEHPDYTEEFMHGDDAWGGIGILWNEEHS